MINDKWVRAVIIGTVVVCVLSIGTYIGLRLRATYYTEYEVLKLRSEHETLQRDYRAVLERLDNRLSELEQSVYGQLEPAHTATEKQARPVVRPIPREIWAINRDKELRERIRRLELWRLQQDAK